MRNLMALIAVTCLAGGAARADSSQAQMRPAESQKQKDIRTLLKLTGSVDLAKQVMGQIVDSMKKGMPQVPEKFWSDFLKEVNADELVDLIVPVYDRNLTQQDVSELIKFYQTPTGKKFVAVMPKITQESMVIGETWGRQLAARVLKKLETQPK